MTSEGATAQDGGWKAREQSEEARYIHEKEQSQLAAIREQANSDSGKSEGQSTASQMDRDFEGGFVKRTLKIVTQQLVGSTDEALQ